MKTKNLILCALFIAISFVGANIKIMGSIAFDSMAGFLGALVLGPLYGAAIGALGHFLTALTSGFPLTLPVHIITMLDMALTMFAFGVTYNALKNKNSGIAVVISALVGIIINSPIALLMDYPLLIKIMPKAEIIGYLPVLTLAAALNVVIALVIYKFLPGRLKKYESD
jgi:uncharacterized membrane protein